LAAIVYVFIFILDSYNPIPTERDRAELYQPPVETQNLILQARNYENISH